MSLKLNYLLIRFLTFPLTFFPLSWIHFLGRGLGSLAYYCLKNYRKRTLSNLSLATSLEIADLKNCAKRSFQHLAITCLEYPKLAKMKKINNIATCVNPEIASSLMSQGQSVIFFCGHQSNWELLFIEATMRMPGVAIGRPTRNPYLYNWILSIREKYGGKMITPKETMKEGLRALRKGKFLGIVGDQGLPESPYAFDFFGRRAWTNPAPALLSYRTGSPIIVATIRRIKNHYKIHYSPPIFPNKEAPLEGEVQRMMKEALFLLQEDIQKAPEQWLWLHNRWKQETPSKVFNRFRHDSILIMIDSTFNPEELSSFREIYPRAFITLMAPSKMKLPPLEMELIRYVKSAELWRKDYRFKLVFNFTSYKGLSKHYKKQAAIEVLGVDELKKAASSRFQESDCFSVTLKKALTRTEPPLPKESSYAP